MRRRMIVRIAVAVTLGSLCKCDFHVLRIRSSRRPSPAADGRRLRRLCARVQSDRFLRSELRCPPSGIRKARAPELLQAAAACTENFAHQVIAEFQFVFSAGVVAAIVFADLRIAAAISAMNSIFSALSSGRRNIYANDADICRVWR